MYCFQLLAGANVGKTVFCWCFSIWVGASPDLFFQLPSTNGNPISTEGDIIKIISFENIFFVINGKASIPARKVHPRPAVAPTGSQSPQEDDEGEEEKE